MGLISRQAMLARIERTVGTAATFLCDFMRCAPHKHSQGFALSKRYISRL
jgi:hypothetical protein